MKKILSTITGSFIALQALLVPVADTHAIFVPSDEESVDNVYDSTIASGDSSMNIDDGILAFNIIGSGNGFQIKDDGWVVADFNANGGILLNPNTSQFVVNVGPMIERSALYFQDVEQNDYWVVNTDNNGKLQIFNDDLLVDHSLFVDTAGELGVGTTTPNARIGAFAGTLGMSVDDTLEEMRLRTNNDNADYLRFYSIRNTACDGVTSPCDWTQASHRMQRRIDVTDMGYLEFGHGFASDVITFGVGGPVVTGGNSNPDVEFMRIDANGDVGIGDTNPFAKLSVATGEYGTSQGDNAEILRLAADFSSTNQNQLRILDRRKTNCTAPCSFTDTRTRIQRNIGGTNPESYLEFGTGLGDDLFTFGTDDNTELITISSEGYLGIGNTGPQYPIDIAESGSANIRVASTATDGTYARLWLEGSRTTDISNDVAQVLFRNRDGGTPFTMAHIATRNKNTTSPNDDSSLLVFSVNNNAGSVRDTMTLTADSTSEYLGIGTDAPTSNLHVSDAGTVTALLDTEATTGADAQLVMRGARTTSNTDDVTLIRFANENGGDPFNMGEIAMRNSNTSTLDDGSTMILRVKDNFGNMRDAVNIVGGTSSTSAFVGINDTANITYALSSGRPSTDLTNRLFNTSGLGADVLALDLVGVTTPGTGNHYVRFRAGSGLGTDGSISGNGGGGVLYNTSSDARIKTNIKDFAGGLELISKTRPILYNSIEDPDGATQIGFTAQEMYDILPSVVTGKPGQDLEEEGPMSIAYGALTPILASAIKELNQKVDDHIATGSEASGPGADVSALIEQVKELVSAVNALYEPKSLTGVDWFGNDGNGSQPLKFNP